MDKNKTAAINPKNNDDMYLLRKKKKKITKDYKYQNPYRSIQMEKNAFSMGPKDGKMFEINNKTITPNVLMFNSDEVESIRPIDISKTQFKA